MHTVLIFSGTGGGGHIAAADALNRYLAGHYKVKSINLFAEVLHRFDLVNYLTFGHYHEEELYNVAIQRKRYWFINAMFPIKLFYFRILRPLMRRSLIKLLKKEQPDVVISVMVLANQAIIEACAACDIPFLLVPTDLDCETFVCTMKKVCYPKFCMNMPFNDSEITKKALEKGISPEQIACCGLPLRENFFAEHDKDLLCKKYGFDPNIPIVLITMGAQGSSALFEAVKSLSQLSFPVQLMVTLGNSSYLCEKIETIPFKNGVTCRIFGPADEMNELMAMADLIVAKSGSATFCEAIQMGKPILFDGTINPLVWEQFNHLFVKKYGIGNVFTSYEQLYAQVFCLLNNDPDYKSMCENLVRFKRSDPAPQFRALLDELIGRKA